MGAERIFGFDIGTTSVGWAVIDHDVEAASGAILGMGVRIFPEARDAKGTPLNQTRRTKRMARRQLRRRKQRRRELNETLTAAGLLPSYGSPEWDCTMREDPWSLRRRGLTQALTPHEVGRALYHLAKHRHFRGRELEEGAEEQSTEEAKQADQRASLLDTLKTTGETLGEHLASRGAGQRKRGEHASRDAVRAEFKKLWTAQAAHIEVLDEPGLRDEIEETIFFQRPVFWRKSTLGECPLVPGADLCPKGSWLSHQRRMLEKLNNLEIAGGNQRPLDPDERAAILTKLQTQAAMTWPGVRTALAPIFAARGDKGGQARLKFNLEVGGDSKLPGNPLEAKLASLFGASWPTGHADAVRASIHQKLWACDYGAVGSQRIVILPSEERVKSRAALADDFAAWFKMAPEEARSLASLTLSSGWEPYSTEALERVLPELERGTRFGALIVSPDYEEWRDANFPERVRPTGEVRDRLPSPQDKDEQVRLSKLRNPTVVRTQNELRKVVNNLIGAFGKPDRVRIELAREVGLSKREREEMTSGIRKNEKRREDARKHLQECGIWQPSKRDIDKWLLWKECHEECPYTGDKIGFNALFGPANRFDIEHIWPRRMSFDDSQRNKTLCRKDINIAKGQRIPFDYFRSRPEDWEAVKLRLQRAMGGKNSPGFSPAKVKRFLAESVPEDFASRQLNDTGYATRLAVEQLKRLWPDVGPTAEVRVQSVNGRVTAELRKLWGLNNILSDDGVKTRADHRHHAIDALTVACANPGMTNRLSRYWQQKDDPTSIPPTLAPPWPTVRVEADRATTAIVVSHRVRNKVSGPLHKETVYGDTGEDVTTSNGVYRRFVTRKKLEDLSPGEIDDIRDPAVRDAVREHIVDGGGDLKKGLTLGFPRVSKEGAEVRKVRLTVPMKFRAVAPVATGYAATGSNHHIAFYHSPDGKTIGEVVSLFEASKRLARREPIVAKSSAGGNKLSMSLSQGDTFHIASGERSGYWTVKTIAANGQIFCKPLADADPSSKGLWGPSPAPLFKLKPRKVSVDPIGRVRAAND